MLITQSNYQAHVPPDSPKLRQSHRQLTDPRLRSVLSLPKFPSNFAYDKELLFAVSGGWGTSQTDGHQGLVMVNVTPPTDANVVGIYNTPGNTSPQFVKVIDESTYMTLGHGVGPGGFEIVNSSDRTALHRIGFYAIPNGARRFEINENTKVAYIQGGFNQIYTLDFTTPDAMQMIGTYIADEFFVGFSATTATNRAYYCRKNFVSLDTSIPTNLNEIGSYPLQNQTGSTCTDLKVLNNMAYMTITGDKRGVFILEVSQNTPDKRGMYISPTQRAFPRTLDCIPGVCYIGYGSSYTTENGVDKLDVTNSDAPTRVDHYMDKFPTYGFLEQNGLVYLGTEEGVSIIDMRAPNPTAVPTFSPTSFAPSPSPTRLPRPSYHPTASPTSELLLTSQTGMILSVFGGMVGLSLLMALYGRYETSRNRIYPSQISDSSGDTSVVPQPNQSRRSTVRRPVAPVQAPVEDSITSAVGQATRWITQLSRTRSS